jgi:hypothetical protein
MLIKDDSGKYPLFSVEKNEIVTFDHSVDAIDALAIKDPKGEPRYKEVEPLKKEYVAKKDKKSEIDEIQGDQIQEEEKKKKK